MSATTTLLLILSLAVLGTKIHDGLQRVSDVLPVLAASTTLGVLVARGTDNASQGAVAGIVVFVMSLAWMWERLDSSRATSTADGSLSARLTSLNIYSGYALVLAHVALFVGVLAELTVVTAIAGGVYLVSAATILVSSWVIRERLGHVDG